MRIIAGKNRGQKLLTFESDIIRPYTDRIKESVFSSLQFKLIQSRVMDLYAGSGSIGFEALSRGASFVSFNDTSLDAVKLLKKNAEKLKIEENFFTITLRDAIDQLKQPDLDFNLVFLDPPFALKNWTPLFEALVKADWVKTPLLIARHETSIQVEIINGLYLKREKKFGKSIVKYVEIEK